MTQVQPRGLTNKAQLSDDVAAYVRDLIMSGQIRQGEYIRLEPLADQLGISATPVREGLLALRGEGFVQLAPRRGFIVSPLSRKDVRDLFMIQASVAGELAARAAVDIDGAQVKHVFALQATLESAALAGDPEDIEVANFEFHRAINRIADSQIGRAHV